MRFAMVVLVICAAIPSALAAAPSSRLALDGSAGVGPDAQRLSVSVRYSLLRGSGRWDLGVGGRITGYAGNAADYTNRDDVQGAQTRELRIDPSVVSLNGMVFGEVRLVPSVTVGANLDLIGLATGPTREIGSLKAEPQRGSYFAYGDADHGALNSEFFAAIRLGESVRLRAGLSHYVTNYIVSEPGSPDARYQRFDTVPFAALEWRP